jgi:hypothetical protein
VSSSSIVGPLGSSKNVSDSSLIHADEIAKFEKSLLYKKGSGKIRLLGSDLGQDFATSVLLL